jgi:hypothetical protein
MNALKQFFGNPIMQALFVLAAGIYILNSNSSRFLSDVSKSRDDMVASLRQAQTPEPQVAAISKGFDQMTSDVHHMALSFFSFTMVMLVATISARHRSESPRQEPQSKIVEESRQQAVV